MTIAHMLDTLLVGDIMSLNSMPKIDYVTHGHAYSYVTYAYSYVHMLPIHEGWWDVYTDMYTHNTCTFMNMQWLCTSYTHVSIFINVYTRECIQCVHICIHMLVYTDISHMTMCTCLNIAHMPDTSIPCISHYVSKQHAKNRYYVTHAYSYVHMFPIHEARWEVYPEMCIHIKVYSYKCIQKCTRALHIDCRSCIMSMNRPLSKPKIDVM